MANLSLFKRVLKSAVAHNAVGNWLFKTLVGASTDTLPVADITFTVGAESSNVILVTAQLVDGLGKACTEPHALQYYVSTDTAGQAVASDLGTLAIATHGTIIKEHTDDVLGLVVSEATGLIDLNFTSTTAQTSYIQFVMPNGKLTYATVTHA